MAEKVNLNNYTPTQFMARGVTAEMCPEYHDCKECPLWTIDRGKRPLNCTNYSLQHPVETLKAFGVKDASTVAKMETVDDAATPITRAECLDKAKAIVTGHREQDYGKPEDSFAVIAQLWDVYVEHKCYDEVYLGVDAQDVANMMMLLKLGRIISGTATADSYVDIAGYAACGCEIATGGDTQC